MIDIEKDINIFGIRIFKGSEVSWADSKSSISIMTVTLSDNNNKSISYPIIPKNYNKTFDEILSEIVKQNTNHNSYYEYLKYVTK